MMKRILSILLTLTLVLSIAPLNCFVSAEGYECLSLSEKAVCNEKIKVYFTIPEGVKDVWGLQFDMTPPSGYIVEDVESLLTSSQFYCGEGNNRYLIYAGINTSSTLEANETPIDGKYALFEFFIRPKENADILGTHEINFNIVQILTKDEVVYGEGVTFSRSAEITHAGYNATVVEDPTCEIEGKMRRFCQCGHEIFEPIAAGHQEVVDVAVAETCTTNGLTEGSHCSRCNMVFKAQKVIPAVGHNEIALPARVATYTAPGLTAGKKCTVCRRVTVPQKAIPMLQKPSLKNAEVTVKDQTYNGKAKKPAVTVTLNGKQLKKNLDFTITYKNNKKIGTATATVTGIGTYKDSIKKTFKINPKKIGKFKVKAGKKQMTVSWKKDKSAGGYEIKYATNKNMKKAKRVKVKSKKTYKTVIKKLKSKKTCYVKVRTFKKVGKKTYYGAYTKIKKVKIK